MGEGTWVIGAILVRAPLQDESAVNNSKPFWVKPSVMRIQMVVKTASSPVSLRCPAAGNPMPNITWLRNGEPLVETWRMTFKVEVVQKRWALSFASVTKAYEGDYTCVVANVYGSIQWTYSLEVIERLPHPPILNPALPANQTVYVGDTVTFKCEMLSDLQPHLQWLKHYSVNGSEYNENGKPYIINLKSNTSGDPGKLVIHNITQKDAGWYTCLVGNSIGIVHQSAWLDVPASYLRTFPIPAEEEFLLNK
ncbi:PREDICTED: fibroblast growth factor receptor 3-like [Priapulus caudatus]|uniref:Fibroblast growth factor receptor 3-like n=1 Tax=Priapulus caudatus TaxID=37621 RepID=A0ABM1E5J9_PRICU|nr:PREDICTED: fibroblast growth factor receptor 3-like [Priapulus caudatus]